MGLLSFWVRTWLSSTGEGHRALGRQQQWVYHVEQPRFPLDFPNNLEEFKDAAGLTWRGLARQLKVNARCVRRWRTGTKPDSGHMYSLLNLAAQMGLLHILLPAVADPEAVAPKTA